MIPIPHSLSVFPASAFVGADQGAVFGPSDQMACGTQYRLVQAATPGVLALDLQKLSPHVIRPDSALGTVYGDVFPDACLTMTSRDGGQVDLLLLVETDAAGAARALWCAPLAPLCPGTLYTITQIDQAAAQMALARLVCLAFRPGTRIALSTGAQVAVEDLKVGDKVLTRDAGPQKLIWVGTSPRAAHGTMAPVRIAAGTLNTINDLWLAPEHRLFFYQRSDPLGTGQPECLIRARHLVDGQTITQPASAPYTGYHLLFEGHHVIFAEGIAVETLQITGLTAPALPADLTEKSPELQRDHRASSPDDFEIDPVLLPKGQTAALIEAAIAG